MGTISFSSSLLLLSAFLLHSHLLCQVAAGEKTLVGSKREVLDITIGGGGIILGDSPSPPPSPPIPIPCPPPEHPTARFENERLRNAYFVIQQFKNRITSDPKGFLKTWEGTDVCKYRGYRCDNYPNTNERTVSGIEFNGAQFSGKQNFNISGFLDRLPDVTFFHANSNNFTCNIPAGISEFKYFFELDLSNNKYTGEFPKEVLGFKQLTFLDLRFNSYYGPLPRELFNLNLDVLFLNHNQFNQKLPLNFGSTTAKYLTFAHNQFTGPIPSSIGKASNTLTEVLFLNNKFSGCLPYEIGYLKKATAFDVSVNQLTGPIPLSFLCLESIRYLNLANNFFYGEVPDPICRLPNLQNLTLSGNYFTSVGPECRKLIEKNYLDVGMNCIVDLPNQKSREECAAFLFKPKYCPNAKSLAYIPCKKYGPQNKRTKSEALAAATAPAPAPVTYRALIPGLV